MKSPQRIEKEERAEIDAALVARFNNGDESAFVELMNYYREKVLGTALALLRNRSDAEEITQDTFIRAHRGLSRFRGDSSFSTWLCRIAMNLSRNMYWYYFRRRRHNMISLDCQMSDDTDNTFADLFAGAESTTRNATLNQLRQLVVICMERLPSRHREMLVLRNELYYSYDDIAAALGVNVGTVKSRLARARGNLRSLIAGECPEVGSGKDLYVLLLEREKEDTCQDSPI